MKTKKKSSDWSQDLDHNQLERALFENGLSFLRRSTRAAAKKSPDHQEMTHAAVELAVSIEVLLKARLAREHWALICVDLNQNTKLDLRSGRARTVTPEIAVARLSGIAGVELDLEKVKNIADLRNRAAHFTLETAPDHALHATFARGLLFVRGLISDQFTASPDNLVVNLAFEFLKESRDDLRQIDEYVRLRLDEVEPDLRSATLCLECPLCRQAALVVEEGDSLQCRFCSTGPHDEELASLYVENVLNISGYETIKDGGEWPVHECFECGYESFVEGIVPLRLACADAAAPAEDHDDRIYAACFSCGVVRRRSQFARCYRCSRPAAHALWPDCEHALFADGDW